MLGPEALAYVSIAGVSPVVGLYAVPQAAAMNAVCQVDVTRYVIQETPFQCAIRTCPPPPA